MGSFPNGVHLMSRAGTFVAIGLVVIVAVYSRRMAIELLGPGSMMWGLVANVQYGTINGEEWATQIYEAVTVWVPWFIVAAAIAGGFFREFRRENVTAGRVR